MTVLEWSLRFFLKKWMFLVVCPICPGRENQQWNMDVAKNHVLGVVHSNVQNDKKKSRQSALARNEGWM
jgi:hypothetical protein